MSAAQILEIAELYAGHCKLKLSTVGAYAANDGKFFGRLTDGYDCRTRTAQRILAWFSENWPADLEWPKAISRPSKRGGAA